jgi:hypothetical protein
MLNVLQEPQPIHLKHMVVQVTYMRYEVFTVLQIWTMSSELQCHVVLYLVTNMYCLHLHLQDYTALQPRLEQRILRKPAARLLGVTTQKTATDTEHLNSHGCNKTTQQKTKEPLYNTSDINRIQHNLILKKKHLF